MKRHLLIAAALLLALGSAGVLAQDDCAAEHFCVDYNNNLTVEIDPTLGDVQGIVVKERVIIAVYARDGQSFEKVYEYAEDKAGAYEDAQLGDVLVLQEAK